MGRLEAALLAADLDATLELLGADPSLGSGLGASASRALVSMARTAFESGRPGHAVRLLQPMAGVADLGPEIPLLLARSYLSMTDGKSRDRAADPLAQAIRLQDPSQVASEAMILVEASGKLSPQARLPVEKVLLEKAAELVARKARGQAESLLVPLSGRGGTVGAEAWIRIGELAEGSGDAKAACQAYKKGLDADSGWRSILSRKTMEDFARELDKRATTDALARVNATRLWRALRAFNDHGFEESMKELTQVVKHHPEARPALSRYYAEAGQRVLAQGRRNLVFPLGKGALDLDSRNPLAHKVLGDFYLGPDGAVEKALYHYRAALRSIGLAK